jgi:CubicO group peptidase (beta-lactamase class C family)
MWRVIFATAAFLGGQARSAMAQSPDTLAPSIDRVFDKWHTSEGPGCAVGVSRRGRTVFERGYGMANLETETPIQPTSIFHVASIAKQFTAAAILLLERDGKLSLDDDIRKYLPEIPDYGTTITIRHLLAHTSGLRDQWELLFLARGRFEEDRITETDVLDIVARQTALNFKPGTESLYSNTGYTLLAVIVKRASGQSLRDFAAARLFQPLGMAHTHFHDDYTMVVPGRVSGYELRAGAGGPWRVSNPNYDVYGATNLFTTVGDLLKWEATLEQPIVGDSVMFARMEAGTVLVAGDTTEYGLGLRRARTYRGMRVSESSGNDPGFQAYVGRYPDQHLAIAVLCNAGSGANPTALGHRVADVFLETGLAAAPAFATGLGVALPPASLQSRVGVYVHPATLAIVRVIVRDSNLVIAGPDARALIPLAHNRFAVPGDGGELVFRDGVHAGYERRVPGQQPAFFEWHQSASPSPAMLAAYGGAFVSSELGGALYQVSAGDSTLILRTGTSDALVARPAFADTFVSGGYTIQFMRSHGRIAGFEVTNPRMRRVKFTRAP